MMMSNMTNGVIVGGTGTDGSWMINVHVTDLNVTRQFRVRGDTHIGGLMLRMVEDIDVTKDWSDHALWWPKQNCWLTHTRSTLDQCRVSPESVLEFTPMHKAVRVQMPDLQCISAIVNYSVPVFNAVVQFCKDLGIRYQEELSFKRYIPPEVLAKGAENKEYQLNTTGVAPALPPNGRNPLSQSVTNLSTVPRNAPIVGQTARHQLLPVSASSTSLSRAGSSPPMPTKDQDFNTMSNTTAPFGTKYSTMSPNYNLLNNPGLMTTTQDWQATLSMDNLDQSLINSPKNAPAHAINGILRPKNYAEKAALNAGWLDSSRSLLEQGFVDNDFILLRFKFLTFFDLNPKVDQVRINQIYEQAKWAIITEEFDTTEAEAYNFAALQLQVQLKTESKQRGEPEEDVDDVDVMLTDLENLLEGNWVAKYGDTSTGPELSDYLQFYIPKKNTFKQWRRAFFVLQNLSVHWYNNASDSRGPPMGRIYLRGADISYDVSVPENKYDIKLMIPSQDGLNEFWLKCDSEQRFAKWLAACQLASRGKTMSDISYSTEVEMIHSLLSSQHPTKYQAQTTSTAPQNINPDDFLPSRHSRMYKTDQSMSQRIVDSHSKVSGLNLVDAKLQYIRAWQQLREYSLHYFVVRVKGSRRPELLVITHNRMIRMNLDSEGAVKIWPYANMKKWHVNWEIRHIFIQMDDEDIELACLSSDVKVPHEFIGGYIFMSTRSKDKNQILDGQLFHQLTAGWQPNPHYFRDFRYDM